MRDISGRHGVAVGGFAVASSGDRVVIIATIDNLLKGAATQALQNINLSLVDPRLNPFHLLFLADTYLGIR